MMRKVALLLVLIVGMTNLPVLTVHAASPPANLAKALQQVDQLLDRARRNLAAADELVDKKQMAAKDQMVARAMRLTGEAARKIESALAMVRALGSTKPSKEQLGQIEQLIGEARAQLREAEAMIDRVAQKTQNHKLLRGLVTGADHRIDEAVKMLRRIAASLS
ncbi:MAG: hypothetical protein E6G98_08060 [Bacillati bacterium ANGP1]|uniref:Uncharacterized protein n=1 Tax=Candidatus Segetimicrobium genomatis TaxID=2569760 RepID=A0A537LQ28_9BACT|nr:MAG: hypothetical protein E6G98_08060 [Terrabacteria group bacterium ANGP1]